MEIDHPVLGVFEVLRKIGEGSFASVYLARHSVLQYLVALKIFHGSNKKEKIHKSIVHPFICQDFDLLKMPNGENCVIMEYVEGETLLDYINHNPLLPEEEIRYIFGQLVIAIEYLHKHQLIHRDLKCENIMIDKNQNIRLIDLDFSCQNVNSHLTICGSPGYIAPEMLNQKLYGNSIDIWSLGIIIYAISYGLLPFDNRNISHMIHLVTLSEPTFPRDKRISPNLVSIIKKMLIKNPDQRITLEEIKKDPFFTFDSSDNEYVFNENSINCLIVDLCSKINLEKNIFKEMNLTTKETEDATSEILNRQITYNSMTYTILLKKFDTNTRMSYNSINFLCPIKKLYVNNISDSIVALVINDRSLKSSSNSQLPELNIIKTGATRYKFNIFTERNPVKSNRLLANNEIKYRLFSSLPKPSHLVDAKKTGFSSQIIKNIKLNSK